MVDGEDDSELFEVELELEEDLIEEEVEEGGEEDLRRCGLVEEEVIDEGGEEGEGERMEEDSVIGD